MADTIIQVFQNEVKPHFYLKGQITVDRVPEWVYNILVANSSYRAMVHAVAGNINHLDIEKQEDCLS